MTEQLALLPEYLTAHLQLTLVALAIGIGLSVPVGVLVTRSRWLEQPVLGLASVIQTVPSLALLAVMVPLLAALGTRSIGFLPAIIGLTLYSLLPVLRNTVTGMRGIDPALVEAARGVGMTDAQRLRRVELPLALPVIVAGVRTATVWTVGIATLSTPVGATSLGNYIFTGLQTRNYRAVLVGCVAAAGLALVLDGLVRLLESGLRSRRAIRTRGALAAFAVLYAGVGASFVPGLLDGRERPVLVGTKTFTEQYVLGNLIAGLVERETGARAELVQSLGSTVAFDALRSGQIDVYVDYSGTIWATVMKREGALPQDRASVLREVDAWLRETHGIEVAARLGFENTYALAMRGAQARELGIARMSQLVPHARGMTIGGDYEFFGRPEWQAIVGAYGLAFASKRSMDSSLMYQAAAADEVDVISAFSTDGRIAAFDLTVLEDDRGAIPPYDAIVLAGPRLRREHPEVVEALRALEGALDADRMRRLNLAVDRDGKAPAEVARGVLAGLESRGGRAGD